MTKPVVGDHESAIVRGLAAVVLVGLMVRIVAAVGSGIADIAQSTQSFPDSRIQTAETILIFGGAGDGVSVLLALVATGLAWWLLRAGEPAEWVRSTTAVLFAVLAVSAVAQAVGYVMVATDPHDQGGVL